MDPTMTASLKEVLGHTLENLRGADFKRLKHHLQDQGHIAWRKLEKADTDDTVYLMVQVYSTGAGDVMLTILKKMNHNLLAMDLEKDLGRLGGQQCSPCLAGVGGEVKVNATAHSGGMVNAPAMTGFTIRGPVTFNFGGRHIRQQEGGLGRVDAGVHADSGGPTQPGEYDEAQTVTKKTKESNKLELQKQLRTTFSVVHKESGDYKFREIYTKLCIVDGFTSGVRNTHEVLTIDRSQIGRGPSSEDKPVKLAELFTDKSRAKVLTLGIAGIGKTVAVQKFVMDWVDGEANTDIDFVFVLPFRELNVKKGEHLNLLELLQSFYPDLKDLKKVLALSECKIIFVLDGLDESNLQLDFCNGICNLEEKATVDILITSLIEGKLLPSAHLWVTTRPAAAVLVPRKCFNLVTEVQGFEDLQKIEFFQKNIKNKKKAQKVIEHVHKNRSLYNMCHIPVFCVIVASVLDEAIEEEMEGQSEREPFKTLTQMYTLYCVSGIGKINDLGDKNISPKEKGEFLVKLGKLAFKHLEKGNLIFYENDFIECDIDVQSVALKFGMCTPIFKIQDVICQEKVFSFVHLSVQEFLAALYVLHEGVNWTNPFLKTWWEWIIWLFKHSRFDLYTFAVEEALQSQNGHLDLFVRFLLGLAPMLESEIQSPLNSMLPRLTIREVSIEKTVQYIKEKIREDISPERTINLFHCLNELGDNSLVEEINRYRYSADGGKKLTPAQCSTLVYLLLMYPEKLDEFDLKKYLRSEEGLRKMLPVVKVSKRVWLNQCQLYKASCEMMASVLRGSPSHLRELDMSENDLQDEGLDLLCEGLRHPRCKLEKLRLTDCKLSERSCEIVASALQSANSPLRELDLGDNDLQKSGEMLLSALQSPNCKLEILRLAGCKLTGRFLALTLQGANRHLRELNISDSELQDCEGELLHQPLNQDCKLRLIGCNLTQTSSAVVASVLQSFISQLSGLDMSGCDLQTSEEKLLSGLGNPNCQLKTLRLKGCKLKNESYKIVASFLLSATSLLELDLSDNKLGDSRVQLLSKGLSSPRCKLQALRLSDCLITQKGCSFLASALKSNPSYLKELDLNNNNLGDSGVKELTDRLNDPNCKLETFRHNHRTKSLSQVLRRTLENLTSTEFKKFKHHLLDQGQIAWRKLEKADTDDTVDLMVQVYSTGAGDVMLTILKKMNLNQLAMDLE